MSKMYTTIVNHFNIIDSYVTDTMGERYVTPPILSFDTIFEQIIKKYNKEVSLFFKNSFRKYRKNAFEDV